MHARAHVAHSRMHAGTRACRYTCLRIVAEAGANRAYACTRRPSCGGRMRGSCPREKRNVRACVRDPSDSRVPTTRNSNAKRRDRIACHRRVPRDHRHSRSREARGGSQEGWGKGARFNCGIEISRWTRFIYRDATSGSRSFDIPSRVESKVKSCCAVFFFLLFFSSWYQREINGRKLYIYTTSTF